MKWTSIAGGLLALLLAIGIVSLMAGPGIGPVDEPPVEPGAAPKGELANPFEMPTVGPFAKAEVTERKHAFGSMAVGDKGSHDFVIKNVGEAVLKLAKGPSTCKCTLSQLQTDSIAPGESTIVKLEWELKEAKEEFSQQAAIWTNDPTLWVDTERKDGGIILEITGSVEPPFVVYPDTISLGTLSETEPHEFKVAIYSRVHADLNPQLAKISAEYLKAEIVPMTEEELKEMKAKSGAVLKGIIRAEMPLGEVSETIVLTSPKSAGNEVTLSIAGRREGPFQLAGRAWDKRHGSVRLGEFKASEGKKVTISLYSSEKDEPVTFEVGDQDPAEMKVAIRLDEEKGVPGQVRRYIDIEIPPVWHQRDTNTTRAAGSP